jgi:Putative Ig domain
MRRFRESIVSKGRGGDSRIPQGMARLTYIVVFVASLAIVGSAPAGGISDEPCMNVAGENTNTCPTGKVGVPYSLRFVEREGSGCGPGRQTFHFDSGELPPELALALDGTLSGTPTQAGVFRFYVEMREPQDDPTHCAGKRTQKQFTLKICSELGIVASTPAPPRAEVGVRFRMQLSSCAGVSALTWIRSAGVLPVGVQLRLDGSIAGAPREAGTHRFTIQATDVRGRVGTYTGTISVAPRLRLGMQRLAAARVGRAYRDTLAAVGGTAPKLWTISRGRLPRGIHLDRVSGVLAGTAAEAGTYRVTIRVRDQLRVSGSRTLSLVVLPARARP